MAAKSTQKPRNKAAPRKAKRTGKASATRRATQASAPMAKRVAPKAKARTKRVAPKAKARTKRVAPKAKARTKRVAPKAKRVAPKAKRVAPKAKRVAPKAKRVAPKAKARTRRVAPKAEARTRRVAPKAKRVAPRAKARTKRVAPTAARTRRTAPQGAPTATRPAPPIAATATTLIARKGPRIIPVKRTLEGPVSPPVAPSGESAPRSRSGEDSLTARQPGSPAPTAPSGVRVGRLPPRSGGSPPSGGTFAAGGPPAGARRPATPAVLREAVALAHKLGLAPEAAQPGALRAALEGTATLSVEPRGTGREGTALIAAILVPQTTLVVGADRAQLTELGEKLDRAGVPRCLLDASGPTQLARVPMAKVVLALPGALTSEAALRALGKAALSLVVVLEAQRFSTLSPDFSPAYSPLAAAVGALGHPAVFVVAPGAGTSVRQDVCNALMPGPPTVLGSRALRERLTLDVRTARGEARQRELVELIRNLPRPLVALCARPRDVDTLYAALRAQGLAAHRYHEELRAGVRAAEQLEFSMPGDRRILVATSGFAPSGTLHEEAPEGVPLRYGRRAHKADIRSLVRCQPPASLEQLTDELSLVGRDGHDGRAVVFYDASDRPALEAEAEAARPTGEQLLLLGRALEHCALSAPTITTEALALEARTSRRTAESLAGLLGAMGLVSYESGWLRVTCAETILRRELQKVAERFATVRALDARRIGNVASFALHAGCPAAFIERHAGSADAPACGRCAVCAGTPAADARAPLRERHAPVRRFTVSSPAEDPTATSTFRSDGPTGTGNVPLTAKLADFR